MKTQTLQCKAMLPEGNSLEFRDVSRLTVPTPAGPLTLCGKTPNLLSAVVAGTATIEFRKTVAKTIPVQGGLVIKSGESVLILIHESVDKPCDTVPMKKSGLCFQPTVRNLLEKMELGFVESIVSFPQPQSGSRCGQPCEQKREQLRQRKESIGLRSDLA